MFKEKLKDIGLNESEALVYIELLRLGPQAVSIISKKTEINRSTTYSILKSLLNKGLISSYYNKSIKYFVANDPNSLIGFIDQKCQTYNNYRLEILNLIPKFRDLYEDYSFQKPLVTFYEGIEGVKFVMNDSLTAKSTFRSCLALDKWFNYGLKSFLLKFKKLRLINKNPRLKTIVPDTPNVRAFFKSTSCEYSSLTTVLYVSDIKYFGIFNNCMNIYDDKIALMYLNKGDEYGVLIESKEIFEMHKTIFDLAWNGFKINKQ